MPPSAGLTSPRFPQYQGFVPLSQQQTNTDMDGEAEIPLAPMRTNASSNGLRRPSQSGMRSDFGRYDGPQNSTEPGRTAGPGPVDEKHGLFHRSASHPAGRRRVKREPDTPPGKLHRHQSTFDEGSLNFMGKLYTRVVGASVMIRYLIYVIPMALLLAIPLVLLPVTGNSNTIPLGHVTTNATATPPTVKHGPPLFHLFIWIEASWASLWGGKLVAHAVPYVFMFFCGVVSSGTRKYATVLRALEVPLSLFFWALASWLVFRSFFHDNSFTWVYVIKNILGSLFASSAVFLGERMFVQLISITYHQRSFANRIHESKREIFLLGLLYDASRTLFPMYCPEFADEDYIINDSIDVMLSGGRRRGGGGGPMHRAHGHKKTGSVAPMRLIGDVGRFGDKVTSVFGNLASEITGKQVFNPNSAHSIVVEALEKTRSSEALARRIWMSFAVEDRDTLSLEDVEEVLGPSLKEEADECFTAIDADGNGDISLDEMVRKVIEMGKERKAIANSMKDIGQALSVFDSVLLFVVLLIVVFIFLAFFQSSFITTLATAGTALLSLSFVFAVTTQEFLGSCIFLFVKHPYDVGDRVDIAGPEKEQLIVEKISLLFTVFVRIDKMQVVQVPNIVLNGLWIENVTRSRAMRESVDVSVSYDTSFEDIELLRLEMEKFVRHPDNARDFQPDISIGVAGVGDNLGCLQLKLAIKHKSNWHNDVVRSTRRSKFMCALALALKKIPIYAPGGGSDPLGAPANPSYSVTVSDDVAAAARDKAANERNAKRLVPAPLHPEEDDEDDDNNYEDGASADAARKKKTQGAEKQAARELNASDPLTDADAGWGAAMDEYTLRGASSSRDSSTDRTSAARAARAATAAAAAQSKSLQKSGSSSSSGRAAARGGMASSTSLRLKLSTETGDRNTDTLGKTTSQRGRRQAGQALSPRLTAAPGLFEAANPNTADNVFAAAGGTSSSSIDLERGQQHQHFSSANPYAQQQQQQQAANSYSMFPAASVPSQPPMHPLQSAPTNSSSGSRPRGASVSRTQRQ